MKIANLMLATSASLFALAAPVHAQSSAGDPPSVNSDAPVGATGDIIVQARRRDESQQDVPLVVNAVTAASIEKLNIREFEDVENLVPGLSLGVSTNGIGAQASLRGINFDVVASGNNGTIEFYHNDAPLSAGILFQSMFDVGQIEVLRGPQGTLRGRASPSGSITVTTRRPDLSEAGGYLAGTLNDIGGWNFNGAINVPIVEGILGIRVAGVVDENEGTRVRSVNSDVDPFVKTVGGRVSLRAEPVDWLSLFASYTNTKRDLRQFDQVESARLADAATPAGAYGTITADQRLAVHFIPREYEQKFEIFNWQAQVRFGGQKLDYVGSYNKQFYSTVDPADRGAFFGRAYPEALRTFSQNNVGTGRQETHELRLSNDERLFGMFDYVIGGLHSRLEAPTTIQQQTPLFAGILIPQDQFGAFLTPTGVIPAGQARGVGLASVITTPITRGSETTEKSLFGNVTAHITEATELSGGVRYINYRSRDFLAIAGNPVGVPQDNESDAWIFSASAKHRFNEDLMVYASFGTSWRPGSTTNPTIFRENIAPSPLLQSLYYPEPERSKSYEIGFKSDWWNNRIRLNVTAFHQDFDNYAYSARGIYYVGTDISGATRVLFTNPAIAVAVPAKVDGVEAEIGIRPVEGWDISATLSYAKSKIKNGLVPCNPYGGQVPTVAQIRAVAGGENIATCRVNFSAGSLPPFSATVQTEYSRSLGVGVDGYLRGLLNFQGNSQNDPANPFDDIRSYGLLNLFAGIRDPEGAWEIGGYVKNAFNTLRVLNRESSPLSVGFQQLFCTNQDPRIAAACPTSTITFGQTVVSGYRAISVTPPREFGIQARIQFGSR